MAIRNVFITGSNRGIGLELCKQLCQLETTERIIATTRTPQNSTELNKLSAAYKKLHIIGLDAKNYRYYDKLIDDCHKIVRNNGINLLINNAGVMYRDFLPTITANHLSDALETNTIAPLMLTKKLLPLLISSANNGEPTSVVNISSTLGTSKIKLVDGQQWYPYRISKAGLNMVTRLLAFDLSGHNIRVIGIHPGWVKTDMGTKNALLDPEFSVKSFLKVIQTIDDNMNGKLVNYDGKILDL